MLRLIRPVFLVLIVAVILAACQFAPPTAAPTDTPSTDVPATDPAATQTPFVITATPDPGPTIDPTPTKESVEGCLDPTYSDSECPLNEGTMRGRYETIVETVQTDNGPRDFSLTYPAAFDLFARSISINDVTGEYETKLDGELPTMFCDYRDYMLDIRVNGSPTEGRQSYDASCVLESPFRATEVTFRQAIVSPSIEADWPLIIRVVTRSELNVSSGSLPPGLVEIQPTIRSTNGNKAEFPAQAVPALRGDNEYIFVGLPTEDMSFVLDVAFRTRYPALVGSSKLHILAIEVYRAPSADYGRDVAVEF
jgi:hypothetical protein